MLVLVFPCWFVSVLCFVECSSLTLLGWFLCHSGDVIVPFFCWQFLWRSVLLAFAGLYLFLHLVLSFMVCFKIVLCFCYYFLRCNYYLCCLQTISGVVSWSASQYTGIASGFYSIFYQASTMAGCLSEKNMTSIRLLENNFETIIYLPVQSAKGVVVFAVYAFYSVSFSWLGILASV